jgi:Ca-activated chloride channel family protein
MGGEMSVQISSFKFQVLGLSMVVLVAGLYCLTNGNCSLLTPDQQGYRLFVRGKYPEAAELFADPMWKGIALFRQGEFKDAAGVFAGFDTAEAAFNHGNALVMQGKYEEAVDRYTRAIELKRDWEVAIVNREIALARARTLKKEGGVTGAEMGADEIVFSEEKPAPSAGEEQIEGRQEMSDAELQAIWLRQVQTKPADFLRAKFAYQYARGEKPEERDK